MIHPGEALKHWGEAYAYTHMIQFFVRKIFSHFKKKAVTP
jgi:hypothetical protein